MNIINGLFTQNAAIHNELKQHQEFKTIFLLFFISLTLMRFLSVSGFLLIK